MIPTAWVSISIRLSEVVFGHSAENIHNDGTFYWLPEYMWPLFFFMKNDMKPSLFNYLYGMIRLLI